MRFDLKKPCKHCPFLNTPDRIKFACRKRAEDIEEQAYRHGFVCHQHADWREDDDETGEESGAYWREDGSSQHCAGALLMYLKEGAGNVPYEWLDEDEQDRISARLDWNQPTFESAEEFIAANQHTDD